MLRWIFKHCHGPPILTNQGQQPECSTRNLVRRWSIYYVKFATYARCFLLSLFLAAAAIQTSNTVVACKPIKHYAPRSTRDRSITHSFWSCVSMKSIDLTADVAVFFVKDRWRGRVYDRIQVADFFVTDVQFRLRYHSSSRLKVQSRSCVLLYGKGWYCPNTVRRVQSRNKNPPQTCSTQTRIVSHRTLWRRCSDSTDMNFHGNSGVLVGLQDCGELRYYR